MTNFWFYLSPSSHEKDVYTTPISAVVISTSLYHLGGYEPSSPTTKDLHGVGVQGKYFVVV